MKMYFVLGVLVSFCFCLFKFLNFSNFFPAHFFFLKSLYTVHEEKNNGDENGEM